VALASASAVMAGAAFLILTRSHGGVTETHVLTTPDSLGCYVKQPQLAVQMQAKTLAQQIVKESSGAAKNVVYAVYENTTCGATSASPQIFLFIGGNLSGTSASSLISDFTGSLHGAVMTGAGKLGGEAACVPSIGGRPADCAWADGDTFGDVTSATLSASGLANEMRQARPMVEHPASPAGKQL
jgi:hypothetical protein